MTHFTIHGTADVHSLQEFNFHLFGGGAFKRSTIAFGAGIVFVCLLSYLLEMNLLFLLAIFIIFSLIALYFSKKRFYRVNLQRAEELNAVTFEQEYIFEDNAFRHLNLASGTERTIQYKNILQCIESKNCLFFITKSDLIFQINKSDIPAGQLPALAAFLKEKGIKVPSKLVQK